MRTYIRTFTGAKIHPLDPDPSLIRIEDIAHALSLICRFTGHTRYHYSVAQHSLLCAEMAEPEFALWALLHDASEAYIADIARPLKHTGTFELYRVAEKRLMNAVASRFGLGLDEPPEVKVVDQRMLATELRDLMPSDEPLPYEPYAWHITPMPWDQVELWFLNRFRYYDRLHQLDYTRLFGVLCHNMTAPAN